VHEEKQQTPSEAYGKVYLVLEQLLLILKNIGKNIMGLDIIHHPVVI
jgi:hypothetical protein